MRGRVQEATHLSALDQRMVLPLAGTGKPGRVADLGRAMVSSVEW